MHYMRSRTAPRGGLLRRVGTGQEQRQQEKTRSSALHSAAHHTHSALCCTRDIAPYSAATATTVRSSQSLSGDRPMAACRMADVCVCLLRCCCCWSAHLSVHCITRWLKTRSTCPLDDEEWDFVTSVHVHTIAMRTHRHGGCWSSSNDSSSGELNNALTGQLLHVHSRLCSVWCAIVPCVATDALRAARCLSALSHTALRCRTLLSRFLLLSSSISPPFHLAQSMDRACQSF